MRSHRWSAFAAAILSLSFVSGAAYAQRPGASMVAMSGVTGMGRDSVTRDQMPVIQELLLSHDRITRTVMNLPGGIRTLTESDNPLIARLINDHVTSMTERVAAGDDPNLPMESDAVRTLFRNKDKIRTYTEQTPKGILVVQISSDPATVAALQQHAAEVNELVRGGMAAMHETMMKKGATLRKSGPRSNADR